MNMSLSGGEGGLLALAANCDELESIIRERRLFPVYQPIVDLQSGITLGHEGLIRGPADSPLHLPLHLFQQAAQCGRAIQLDQCCRRVTMERFAELGLPARLFLNVNPETLLSPDHRPGKTLAYLKQIGLEPERIVIELTETLPFASYHALREATEYYRRNGFHLALDDLGEGYSNLRLWSELRPDFVKLDKHFVQNIQRDPFKEQFVRSMVDMARQAGTLLIAEGIESAAELRLLRNLGVKYGQGYLIARPEREPDKQLQHSIGGIVWSGERQRGSARQIVARDLLIEVDPLQVSDTNEQAYRLFAADQDCFAIPVLEQGRPVGLLRRHHFLESFARPFNRELYGKKSCTVMMEKRPLIVADDTDITTLSSLVLAAGKDYLADGFILTEDGSYLGMGTCYDLMRKITDLQISAARYANPLTGLPGNVPINEAIDRLIESSQHFVVAYADLDHFKPFNDLYGYAAGDELIELVANILSEEVDESLDFVGHVGGDDFVVLMQCADWEHRLRKVLSAFDQAVPYYFSPEHVSEQGFHLADRRGEMTFFPLTSLSLGVLKVLPGQYRSHVEIGAAAAEAKKMAKKQSGSSLFIERRRPDGEPALPAGPWAGPVSG
ncbi:MULTISPECIES: GGDEF domain-containing protein [unclassified Paludibacterium]|uniref:GGDEF domain-containing protein n=1 Tax=unclassified Paludibacterium TaxID=2618429 RepID=UPI00207B57DF|nr:GGDEF domain-containing protein [Paludibacterium sp. B53371]BEV71501.1 bifunctional diguanylate cyclase/phosphodiesterase [Paludibacterium sp. THUN1379]